MWTVERISVCHISWHDMAYNASKYYIKLIDIGRRSRNTRICSIRFTELTSSHFSEVEKCVGWRTDKLHGH